MKLNIKNLSKLVLVDFIALALFYYFTKYVIQTIRDYYQIIQGLTPEIDKFGFVLQQNASLFEMNKLAENLDTVSQISNKILLLFLLLGLVSFLLYNISQSINWNLSLNEFKLKGFKTYLRRFTLISIPGFLILSYLGFKIIVLLRTFILDFWFENYFNTKMFFIILVFSLISLIIIYLKFDLYKLINKHSFKDSLYLLKRRFLKEYLDFGSFLIAVFLSVFLFIIILRINPSSALLTLIGALVSLTMFNIFRIYFANS